jgi:hypothetical protein
MKKFTFEQHETRGFLYIEPEIKINIFSKNGRNRCNRVTLGKKSFYYIDLQSYIRQKQ